MGKPKNNKDTQYGKRKKKMFNIIDFNKRTKRENENTVIDEGNQLENEIVSENLLNGEQLIINEDVITINQNQSGNTFVINNSLPEIDLNNPDSSIYTIKNTSTTLKENDILVAPVIRNPKFVSSNEADLVTNFNITGNRIVNIMDFVSKLQDISKHNPDCKFADLLFYNEVFKGLNSILKLKCNNCSKTFSIKTCQETVNDKMNINYAAVLGSISIGIGFSQLKEQLANMSIPCLTSKTYQSIEEQLSQDIQKTAEESMKIAASEEKVLARENGSFDEVGENVRSTLDGTWSRRSYGTNYAALSGSGTIIGHATRKVLWIGFRNKHCQKCAIGIPLEKHECNANYTGSSTGMESDIFVEGFQKSIELYGIKYNPFIADGDSSVHKRINDADPYGTKIIKIECRNHLLRNFWRKLREIVANTKYPLRLRKVLRSKQKQISRAIFSSIHFRKDEAAPFEDRVQGLANDMSNITSHLFGDHSNCAAYFTEKCNSKEENLMSELRFDKSLMSDKLDDLFKTLATKADSLIHDVDSNYPEQFHSIVTKFVGGKRLNLVLGKSYQTRTLAAVIQFNTNSIHSTIHRQVFHSEPNVYIKRLEDQRVAKNLKNTQRLKSKIDSKKQKKFYGPDQHYGTETCEKVDMEAHVFEREKLRYIQEAKIIQKQWEEIEFHTRDQASSSVWKNTRKKLLTSSNFGLICKRKKEDCSKLVKALLYSKELTTAAITHGKLNEKNAIKRLEDLNQVKVKPCGLFIDKTQFFLGSSPDGLLGDDGVVEVKCSHKGFGKSVDEGVEKRHIAYWNKDGTFNQNHNYYYQVQGQLHILGREYCLFVCYTGPDHPIKVEKILYDPVFVKKKMLDQLEKFFFAKLLPEIIDPRYPHRPIRP